MKLPTNKEVIEDFKRRKAGWLFKVFAVILLIKIFFSSIIAFVGMFL